MWLDKCQDKNTSATGVKELKIRDKDMDENKKEELEEKIRELEDKIRRLENEGEIAKGTTAGILKGLGGIIPGLDGLVKGLEKSAAFRERLGAIDREIEVRLRSQPLKKTGEGLPSFQSGFSLESGAKIIPPAKRETPRRVKREIVASKEPKIDVFDEETHLRVLAELPGVEENDIRVSLKEAQLIISTDTPSHKYFREITLPYAPRGQVDKSYHHSLLELTLQKE